MLDVGLGERDPRRHAVDDDADRRPVALAPGRETEQRAEAIAGHRPVSREAVRHTTEMSGRRPLHADDVIAAIDMMDLAGDPGGEIAQQINAGAADILDRDIALAAANSAGSISGCSGNRRCP